MQIYALIGVVWDEAEGAWIPVMDTCSFRPYLTGGVSLFRYRLTKEFSDTTAIILCTASIEPNGNAAIQFHAIPFVAMLSHQLDDYAFKVVRHYAEHELKNDLQERV